jgi:hypothetical protein
VIAMTNRVGKLYALLCAAAASFPALAQAQSGVFRVYAGLAPTSYRITLNIPGAFNATAKSNYAAANLGATWVSPRGVYVDVSGQTSLNAKHDLWDSIRAGQQKFSRDSYTLTGGYIHLLSGGVSISGFGGYTYGKTIFYAPPGFAQSKDIFESKGIFVGAGAGVPALRGQFSGSLAIAGMKGNQKDDAGFDIKADTTFGFSLGGAYTYKLSEALGVTADLRYQQYKYDFGTQIAGYKVTEKMTSLGVRLGYQF